MPILYLHQLRTNSSIFGAKLPFWLVTILVALIANIISWGDVIVHNIFNLHTFYGSVTWKCNLGLLSYLGGRVLFHCYLRETLSRDLAIEVGGLSQAMRDRAVWRVVVADIPASDAKVWWWWREVLDSPVLKCRTASLYGIFTSN